MDELDKPGPLRQYLLGTLGDVSARDRVEERLMDDEDFAARIGAAEDELIEEFLDGEMSAEESDRFSRFFLAPPERKRQLRLTRDLRRISAASHKGVPHPERTLAYRPGQLGWHHFAALGALLVTVGVGVWFVVGYRSDTSRGLEQLSAAYRDRRPTEARLSGLKDYAPFTVTRGGSGAVTDSAALDRAQRYLTDATANSADAEAHHALAVYYLAAGDLGRAEREMATALGSGAQNAKVESDAGALYIEVARAASDREDGAKTFAALNAAMGHLDRAVSLNPTFLDARFNRALCLRALPAPEQAKAAWREYLDLDPNSKWADEARQNLQKLEAETPSERSADQLEPDFLAAFHGGDEAQASKIIADNRELIRDKYIPHRLAMEYVNAPEDRRDELLDALRFAGKLEMNTTGDPFANEIAHFYAHLPAAKFGLVMTSHEQLREGSRLCLNGDYKNALARFQDARGGFEQAGDEPESRLAAYFVGYVLVNENRIHEAATELNSVRAWAGKNGFIWLEGAALHWVAHCQRRSKEITASQRNFASALAIAKKMDDPYAIQRNRLALASLHSATGQTRAALEDLFGVLRSSANGQTSLRQRYRNAFQTFPILIGAGMSSAARPFTYEAIALADRLNDPMWMAQSRGFAGIAAARGGDATEARRLLEESEVKAAVIQVTETRAMARAFADLNFAEFERSLGNFEAAERRYLSAASYYDDPSKPPPLREQVRNGLLRTYLSLGRAEELGKQIPVDIKLTEEYRNRISDEAQSIGFFALKEDVYDVATEFELGRGNAAAAYDYAETSSSRSLLDRIQDETMPAGDGSGGDPATPLNLESIRREMPAGVQIVQYSVFENKIVIWLVSRDGFAAVKVPADARGLADRVAEFTSLISRPAADNEEASTASARGLYDILIAPVRGRLDPEKELCVVPSRFLFDVPFAALIAPDSKPLVETFRILHAPSANVFVAASRNAATRGGSGRESLLAVGDPTFDRRSFAGLPGLPAAQSEASEIAKLYPAARTLLRGRATKSAFLASLPGADVVHFAGHYVVMPGAPMSSFLLLAKNGGPRESELSNSELNGIDLPRTRLFVLAACRGGIETYTDAEGMIGMSRTMLAAKVPLVVAARWDVDSAATAEITKRFHTLRQTERLPTTAALRAAQLEMLNDQTGKFRSPYYWAAFAVYGGHADF